jgi:hypothetical protein
MGHEYLACALVEQGEIGTTPSRSTAVLPHAPEACDRMEVVPTRGGEKMAASLAVVVVEGRVELVGPLDAAAIHDHHDVLAGVAQGRPDLMEIVASLLGLTVGHDLIAACRGAIVDRADDAEAYAAGAAAPRARPHPRVALAGRRACDLTLAQWPCQEARPLGGAPPARAGQGKAPQERCVCREQSALATARLVLEGGTCERAGGESRRGGRPSAGGAGGADALFLNTQRPRSRPRWTLVWGANTGASARHLPGA